MNVFNDCTQTLLFTVVKASDPQRVAGWSNMLMQNFTIAADTYLAINVLFFCFV